MLEADEVDIDYFTPVASTSLAKIFGGDTKIEENASLKYVPTPPQSLISKEEESKATKVIFACTVSGYEWLNNTYVSRGKLGAAIIKTLKSGQYNIILYDANKSTISCTMVSPLLEVVIKGNINLSFYDNQKKYWSIYGTQIEFPSFIEELKSLNVLVKDGLNQSELTEKSVETNEEYIVSAQIPKDDKESDTDSSIYKKTKDSILKRMATMGHSVLPTQSIKCSKPAESSESEANQQKVIRHKPQKGNLRKNLTDKADLHSDSYPEINLTRDTSILNRSSDIPLSQQQLVPIKSTNIITNPIINNTNELSMFMSEQRMNNTELRININRLSDKMEKILEQVQSDSENNSSSRHFQNKVMQKLLDEYENKINFYETFLQSKGFDVNMITKPIEMKEVPKNNINDLDVHKHKIQELQNQIEQQNKENDQLRNDLKTLQEKYSTSCHEFEQTCNEHTKEIDKLKQEFSSKQEEMISKSVENNVLPDNDIINKLKSIMNRTFHSLSANFDSNENYTGTVIKSVIANVIKKETMKALKEV